jgi:hypothetical protein
MKLHENPIAKIIYKIKFYFEVAAQQIGWITNKFPEIMSVLYLLEKFGIILVDKQIIILSLAFFIIMVLCGYIWKKIGLFDVERYVNADKDPVQKELLSAARKINKGEKK